jgi:hypothetical protein
MRNYYVKYNQFGTNFSPDSIGWDILVFGSKKERDAWLDENYHDGNNRVADIVAAKNVNKYLRPKSGQIVVAEYDEGRKANKLTVRW